MAYSGFLIKVGEYTIPFKYIKFNSYDVRMSFTDVDAYRDANIKLHRNVQEHFVIKCEWETPAMLDNDQFGDLMSNIQANYINEFEKQCIVTAFVPELNDYVTQEMYLLPEIPVSIYRHNIYTGKLQYNSIRLAFIGY